jgi:uncharacterized protein (TIGR02996 family)
MPNVVRFLQAIREAPEDDDLRLVFADYLEENGDLHAGLVRLSVLRARLASDDPASAKKRAEERQLTARDAASWLGPFAGQVVGWEVNRGLLLMRARASWLEEALATNPEAAEVLRWVETLRLVGDPGTIHRLLESPHLALVRSLNLSWNALGPAGGSVLHRASLLPYLHELNLAECHLGPVGVHHLGRAALPRLRILDLTANDLTDEGARALADSPLLKNLDRLVLNKNRLTPRGIAAVLESAYLSPATRVMMLDHLTGSPRDDLKNQLGGAHESLLLQIRHREGQQEFRLAGTMLGDVGLGALVASPLLTRFHTLQVRDAGIGWRGARDLADSPNVINLVELDLCENGIGPDGTRALARSPYLEKLERLELGDNSIGDTGARDLAASTHLRRLRELRLSNNGIGDIGLRALLHSALTHHLEWLDLGDNRITDVGAESVLEAPYSPTRLRLRLGRNAINETARHALERRFGGDTIFWY